MERDDAGAADEEVDAGLLDPAVNFRELRFECGDGFDGVAGDRDFGIVGAEFVGCICGTRKGAIRFFVEARADGVDRIGEKGVELDVEVVDGETGFDGGELGQHKWLNGLNELNLERIGRERAPGGAGRTKRLSEAIYKSAEVTSFCFSGRKFQFVEGIDFGLTTSRLE